MLRGILVLAIIAAAMIVAVLALQRYGVPADAPAAAGWTLGAVALLGPAAWRASGRRANIVLRDGLLWGLVIVAVILAALAYDHRRGRDDHRPPALPAPDGPTRQV